MSAYPLVIAHRGASGYLPEHTAEAKALAYGQGADYLEQDVVATRDGELLVLHDIYLERVTDVAERFPARRRENGHYYAVDFELTEVRALRVGERRAPDGSKALYGGRFPVGRGRFRISTLAEEIELVQGLNAATGRHVGIYPEIKEPSWHRQHGIDLSRLLLEQLALYGYRGADDPVFVQCFDAAELKRLRAQFSTRLRLVQLVDTGPEHAALLEPAGLGAIGEYADAIGPPLLSLVDPRSPRPTKLLASAARGYARDAGLAVHPYTFRRERLAPFAANLEEMLALYLRDIEPDGLFCDFPDVAVAARTAVYGPPPPS
jgi:glycerophosphoryl diester phosphodiesterase